MGWNSAGAIFNPVAETLIEQEASAEIKRAVLGRLIGLLRADDWDTLDESAEEFRHDTVIVGLFRDEGVMLPCDAGDGGTGFGRCTRRLAHDGNHVDEADQSWWHKSDSR